MKYQLMTIECGSIRSYPSSSWRTFEAEIHRIDRTDCAFEYDIRINGKSVNLDQALEAVRQAREDHDQKRLLSKNHIAKSSHLTGV